MGCCGCGKKVATEAPAVLYKPYSKRGCTDILCCILFLVFLIGFVVIGITAVSSGDTNRLLYGVDYNGEVCLEPKQRIYYPKITEDILGFIQSGETNPLNMKLFGVCVESCPAIGGVVCTTKGVTAVAKLREDAGYDSDHKAVLKANTVAVQMRYPSSAPDVKANCWISPLPTKEYFFRCMWARETNSNTTNTCQDPETLRGMDLDAAAASSDPNVRELATACVVKKQRSESEQTGGAQENVLLDQMLDTAERVGRYVSDAWKAKLPILICGAVMAVIMGYVWLVIIRFFAWFLVWLTVWLSLFAMLCLTLYAYFKAGLLTAATVNAITDSFNSATGASTSIDTPSELDAADDSIATRWSYFAYLMTAITLIMFVLILYFRTKINTAIGIIKEASTAIRSMLVIMLCPFISMILLLVLMIYWVGIASMIYSQGDITGAEVFSSVVGDNNATAQLLCPVNETTGQVNTTLCAENLGGKSFAAGSMNNYLLIYHFFGLLWLTNYITGFFIVIVAGAISYWYFNRHDSNKNSPVINSIKTTLRYHLGSIAFGSLIIAIIQFIRAILAYLDKKSKKAQQSNMLVKFVFKCLACCLWCFEKCVKYISKNAYIMIAMQGTSFLGGAIAAIKLMLSEASTFIVVNVISGFVFMLGKIMIAGSCGFVAFLWLDNASNFQAGGADELESFWVPVLLTLILAYFVGAACMDLYDLAIDTILLCFLIDVGRSNAGESISTAVYASPTLLKACGKTSLITVASVEKNVLETGKKNKQAGAGAGAGASDLDV